jgi:tetratricopeptide (TPR) repeat protein
MSTHAPRSRPGASPRALRIAHALAAHARLALVTAIALGAAAATPPAALAQETHSAHASAPAGGAPRLLDGLGRHHRRVATADPRAQRWFDQGLRLAYAFNHGEALRSFREAARLDPRCAMCHWGIAYVLGPNINAPMDAGAYAEAHGAARRALALAGGAGSRDSAIIAAMAVRYAPAAPAAGRAALDSAYAAAAGHAARRWADDPDAATLHAESVMLLSPWAYWTRDRAPRPGTPVLLGALERALRRDRDHPGACHYYIHAVEAAYPARALRCAERLAALMPGAGHIVHMPGHIYLRVGRYNDAITANRHALHADETYLTDAGARAGFYAVAYYPHNSHFLAFAATMAGRAADALAAARDAARHTPGDAAEGAPELQLLVAYPHLTLATFGRWDDLAREPLPPARLRTATALAWFARGLGDARVGRPAAAAAALDTVRAVLAGESRYPAAPVLQIATRVLGAELHQARGNHAAAVAELEAAVALEDALTYMEPPYWHQPVRHLLGAALLASGRAPEATRRYREDLNRFPENVWSLAGLARSLAAEGRASEAAAVRARLVRAARHADVQVAASRR